MRSMVEGQVRRCVTSKEQDMRPVPLHQLRWSPSPKGEELRIAHHCRSKSRPTIIRIT